MPCWEAADLLAGVDPKVDPRGPLTVPNPFALPCPLTRAEAGPSQAKLTTGHEAGRQGFSLSVQQAVTSCDGVAACKHPVSARDGMLGGGRPPAVPNPSAFPCSLTRAKTAPSQVRSGSGHRQEGLSSAQEAVASGDGIVACKHSASTADRGRELKDVCSLEPRVSLVPNPHVAAIFGAGGPGCRTARRATSTAFPAKRRKVDGSCALATATVEAGGHETPPGCGFPSPLPGKEQGVGTALLRRLQRLASRAPLKGRHVFQPKARPPVPGSPNARCAPQGSSAPICLW